MATENLNDIIIEDAETSKGNQLKNILTLLALLFIILVISIVITKLILGGDDNNETAHLRADGAVQEMGENNLTGGISEGLTNSTNQAVAVAGAAALAGAATVALTSKNSDTTETTQANRETTLNAKTPLLAERNTTSRTKVPLRAEEAVKSNTKSVSTETTSPKKRTTNASSTYTRPKYVKKETTTRTTTTRTTTRTTTKSKSKRVTRGYYIKVGAFSNPSTAIKNIKAIKLNYRTTKTKNGKLTRVLIGPFYSRRDAQNHLAKAKANVAADAYIAKIK